MGQQGCGRVRLPRHVGLRERDLCSVFANGTSMHRCLIMKGPTPVVLSWIEQTIQHSLPFEACARCMTLNLQDFHYLHRISNLGLFQLLHLPGPPLQYPDSW